MVEEDKIELRSEEVQEILSRPPHWLIRWGISVVCGIILLFFGGSFFFYYPDVIESEVTVTTENPPAWIIARSTGLLKERYKKDKCAVGKGELIAVLENPASTADVLRVKQILNGCGRCPDSILLRTDLPSNLNLGMIQGSYSGLRKAANDYRSFVSLDLYQRKINALRLQMEGYSGYMTHLRNQVGFSRRGAEIAEKDYNREKQLYEKQLSSQVALEESDKALLSARQGAEQLMTGVSSATIEMAKLESSLAELVLQQRQEEAELQTSLRSALEDLRVGVSNWELAYALRSPSAGILSYNEVWKENQNVNSGDKVFSVVSSSPGRIIGRVRIPADGSGKVKKGQRVNIKVNGFPYMEYGFLTGKVESVSLLSNENMYSASVSLPHRLETSYHKLLPFKGELNGSAEIITDELSVAQRILNPIRYVFKKNFNY